MGREISLHAGHLSEESKSPSSDPRLDVYKACAVFQLHVRYEIKPADPENTSQVMHAESRHTIDIGLEQGPGFRAVQEYGYMSRV